MKICQKFQFPFFFLRLTVIHGILKPMNMLEEFELELFVSFLSQN